MLKDQGSHRRVGLDEVIQCGAGVVRLAKVCDDADALRERRRAARLRRGEPQLAAHCAPRIAAPATGRKGFNYLGLGFRGDYAEALGVVDAKLVACCLDCCGRPQEPSCKPARISNST